MARKIITEKDRRNKRKKIIIMAILAIIILGIIIFSIWTFIFNKPTAKPTTINILDSIEEYGYSLSDKDSKYFKAEYEKLSNLLKSDEINEEEYATQVARLFVIDFYTLSTKINKYDVGGNEFFFKDKKEMFEQKAMDTIYATLEDDTYGDRKQSLPEIKNVETISTEVQKHPVNEEELDCYLVKLKMEYTKEMGYDKEASVIVCRENDLRMSVANLNQP